jgi:hypothetical protein
MKLPNLTTIKVADKDGSMHQDLTNLLGQVLQGLQLNFSDEGYRLPELTSAQIAQLDPTKLPNAIFINSTTQQLIVVLNGAFKTVQVV